MAYCLATSSLMPNLRQNASSSPAYLQCRNHVEVPKRRTEFCLRCTQESLSGRVPEPTAAWKSTCCPFAVVIDTTVGFDADTDNGSSHAHSRWPSSQAASAVKDSSVNESQLAFTSSACYNFSAGPFVSHGRQGGYYTQKMYESVQSCDLRIPAGSGSPPRMPVWSEPQGRHAGQHLRICLCDGGPFVLPYLIYRLSVVLKAE